MLDISSFKSRPYSLRKNLHTQQLPILLDFWFRKVRAGKLSRCCRFRKASSFKNKTVKFASFGTFYPVLKNTKILCNVFCLLFVLLFCAMTSNFCPFVFFDTLVKVPARIADIICIRLVHHRSFLFFYFDVIFDLMTGRPDGSG